MHFNGQPWIVLDAFRKDIFIGWPCTVLLELSVLAPPSRQHIGVTEMIKGAAFLPTVLMYVWTS